MPQVRVGWRSGAAAAAAPSVSAILDSYSGAAAAYSLRKLRSGYTGSAIRVRRSSDNTEQNIGFDSDGNLDTYALSAFVGTGNGFVTIWYDQSGNSSNLIQITATLQMRIVYGGVIETINGKPALVNNYNYAYKGEYNATYATPISSPVTMFNIGSNTQVPGAGYLWNGLNSNMYVYSYWTDWMRIGGSVEFALQGYLQNISKQRIINAVYNGSSSKLSINNGSYSTGNVGNATSNGLKLGSSGYGAPAFYQEHIVYPSDKSTDISLIDSNINSYYSVYPNPTSVWNLLTSAYNADITASSSLKTSLFAAYNGESNANDSFGTLNGTAQGGLTYTAGKIGNAFTGNGTNAYVRLPRTTNQFDFTGDFSISLWFNQSVGGNLFNNSYLTGTTNRYGYNLYLQGGRVRFATYKGNTGALSASNIGQATATVINTNTWYHVVITKTTSNAFKMYINGVLQTLTVIDGDLSLNPVYSSSNTVNIGAEQGTSLFFNGKIDSLNTWTKELTQSEITELYNSGNGAQYIGDSFYKPTTNDALNTYNGTAQGGLTYGVGKVGTAFQFNGTNAYVSMVNNSLNLTGDFSISLWYYTTSISGEKYIVSNYIRPTVASGFILIQASTRIGINIYGTSQINLHTNNNTIAANTWYHVTITRKSGTRTRVYLNGVLSASDTSSIDPIYPQPSYPTAIGTAPGYGGYVNGMVDAVNIWQKELTQSDITELYNSGNGKQYPN